MNTVFECDDFVVVDKPAGVLSQKDRSGDEDVAEILQRELRLPFLAPIHRLDRNTSGLLVLAKSADAARRLSIALAERKISRRYLAIVKGDPGAEGVYAFKLRKNEARNQVYVDEQNGVSAETRFVRLERMAGASLLELALQTGKSHQIRVHLAHAGHALLGDRKYARKPWSELLARPALHAFQLQLPDGRCFQAALPPDMTSLLGKLGGRWRMAPGNSSGS